MQNPKHTGSNYNTIEELYKNKFHSFIETANRHIFNKDFSIDAIQDAFIMVHKYKTKHPDRKIREQIVHVLIQRACKKLNKKYCSDLSYGAKDIDRIRR